MAFKHILIATDFSKDADAAAEYVAAELTTTATKITLLTVAPDWVVPMTMYEYVPDPSLVERYQRDALAAALKRVQEKATDLFPGKGAIGRALLTGRSVHDEICAVAREEKCDLVVLGSHGHSALGALLVGSVTQRVIAHAPCPVLVIPREKK